jgi:hypothetical protein
LDGYKFNDIIRHIINARREGTESIISIRHPASDAYDFAERLEDKLIQRDQIKIRRCEYNFDTGILYLDIRGEGPLHALVVDGIKINMREGVTGLIPTIHDATIRDRMSKVLQLGHVDIMRSGIIWKQADVSFYDMGSGRLSSVVGEIS